LVPAEAISAQSKSQNWCHHGSQSFFDAPPRC
jgi:hypothetical protein